VSGRSVYFEHHIVGDQARVAAIDSETGLEVVVFGPAQSAAFDLERLALRKLERALRIEGDKTASMPPLKKPGFFA
jgi:hypothetical protein